MRGLKATRVLPEKRITFWGVTIFRRFFHVNTENIIKIFDAGFEGDTSAA